jgi:hypothetical protein
LINVKAIAGRSVAAAMFVLSACHPTVPPPAGPPPGPPPGPAATAPASLPPALPPPVVALPTMDLPPGPIYRCELAGRREVLTLPENIEALCRRHPEMGPCQYERDACRQRGGRVVTAKGEEVSLAVEAEYDKRVRRVRFQADGVPRR